MDGEEKVAKGKRTRVRYATTNGDRDRRYRNKAKRRAKSSVPASELNSSALADTVVPEQQ